MKNFLTTVALLLISKTFSLGAQDLSPEINSKECVILLHGLGRSFKSMRNIETILKKKGYIVKNISYPSRKHTIETLVNKYVSPAVSEYYTAKKVHFVTHSLGGILVRYYLQKNPRPNLGKVIMFAPPNGGSDIVDTLKKIPIVKWWLGPSFLQLSTGKKSLPNQLEPPNYSIGILAGTKSMNPLLSYLISGENDGKVSVQNTYIKGQSLIRIKASHTWIMNNTRALNNMLNFLEHGRFIGKEI